MLECKQKNLLKGRYEIAEKGDDISDSALLLKMGDIKTGPRGALLISIWKLVVGEYYYFPKYLFKRPAKALPCLASSRAIS